MGNASSFRAGLSRRNGVAAISGVFGGSVVQDTWGRSDTETAHSRRRYLCAIGSCNHSLGIGWVDRNDLVEDVSTSESGSSRCHDRPDQGDRRVPHRGHLGLLVGSLDANIDPIEGPRRRLSVLADEMSRFRVHSRSKKPSVPHRREKLVRTSQCRPQYPSRRQLYYPGVEEMKTGPSGSVWEPEVGHRWLALARVLHTGEYPMPPRDAKR